MNYSTLQSKRFGLGMASLFALLFTARFTGAGVPWAAPVVVRIQPVFGSDKLVLDYCQPWRPPMPTPACFFWPRPVSSHKHLLAVGLSALALGAYMGAPSDFASLLGGTAAGPRRTTTSPISALIMK